MQRLYIALAAGGLTFLAIIGLTLLNNLLGVIVWYAALGAGVIAAGVWLLDWLSEELTERP